MSNKKVRWLIAQSQSVIEVSDEEFEATDLDSDGVKLAATFLRQAGAEVDLPRAGWDEPEPFVKDAGVEDELSETM